MTKLYGVYRRDGKPLVFTEHERPVMVFALATMRATDDVRYEDCAAHIESTLIEFDLETFFDMCMLERCQKQMTAEARLAYHEALRATEREND